MSAISVTELANQDTGVTAKPIVENSNPLISSLDTSMDSGIHDVVIKQEPMDDHDFQSTGDNNKVTVGSIDVKKEPSENVNTVSDRENEIDENNSTDMQHENDKDNQTSVKNTEDEKRSQDIEKTASLQHGSDNVDQGSYKEKNSSNEMTEKLGTDSDPKPGVVEETSNESKTVKDVEESSDPDAVIVESASNLMEYRTAEKVNTVDDSSDSSPDSSDSETDAVLEKEKKAENAEVQINKIISNGREVSPEKERRVKMNRHGFEDVRTKGELLPEELPPLEELTITVDESVVMVEFGSIKSIVGILVVIQSNENVPPLDDETILFVEGHKVLGQVFEVFGPVRTPWYSVRFNEAGNIDAKGLEVGMPVFCAPKEKSFTKFVFVDSLKKVKGSDASWEDNNEPPEKHLDYSDDESERRAKAKRRNKKSGENEREGVDDGEGSVQRKNARNRNRNKPNQDENQHSQHPRRPWNPFQGNQNDSTNNGPPRFGPRPQNGGRGGQPAGQRWPQGHFNRPQSRFGGPPNFQNRPRMGQHQGQQPFTGRNVQSPNNWRPPPNTNYPNNQQNYEFVAQPLVNGPPQTSGSFNFQNPPPPVSTPNFGPIPGQLGQSCPPRPMNVNTSQPTSPFQFGNQVRPTSQSSDTNNWNRPPVNMNNQNVPFISESNNQYGSSGNQSINRQLMSPGNQMLNQGQSVNFTAYQGNQVHNAASRNQLENNASQMSQMNYSSGTNLQQNPFNQPLPNSGIGSGPPTPANGGFHPNFGLNQVSARMQGQFQNNRNYEQDVTNSGRPNLMQGQMGGFVPQSGFSNMNEKVCVSNAPNSTPICSNNMQSGHLNSYNAQQSVLNVQGYNGENSEMQNISRQNYPNSIQNKPVGGNENYVQGQNYRGGAQQGFQQNNLQTGGTMNQFAPTHGFQNNFMQNQTAGQSSFNTSGSNPIAGNMFMSAGNNTGYNQVGPNMQPGVVTDQRFIQNTNNT